MADEYRERRRERLTILLSERERDELQAFSESLGMTLSDFVRASVWAAIRPADTVVERRNTASP